MTLSAVLLIFTLLLLGNLLPAKSIEIDPSLNFSTGPAVGENVYD